MMAAPRVLRLLLPVLVTLLLTAWDGHHVDAAQPAGFVYALQQITGGANQVHGFRIDAVTGELSALPGFPLASGGNGNGATSEQLTYDAAKGRLYAVNDGSQTLSVFAVDRATGMLTPLLFSPVSLGVGSWTCVAVHPTGSPVAVGNGAASSPSLATFMITGTAATAAPGSPFSTGPTRPFSCAFSRDGQFVYAGGNTGTTIAGFSVTPGTGVLTPLPGSPFAAGASQPVAYVTDAAGRLFSASAASPQLFVFTTSAGVPGGVPGNPFASGLTTGVHGVLHPAGFYLVADRAANQVGVYRMTGSGQATSLSAVSGSPFATGGTLTDALALTRGGRFLVAANGQSRNLTVFRVDAATGSLFSLGVQPANTLGGIGLLSGLAFVPTRTSQFDYDADGRADIAVYRQATGVWFVLQSSDGTLLQVPWGSPFLNDLPVAGDFDGDGKADIAVYRRDTGEWFIRQSTDLGLVLIPWGAPFFNDLPVELGVAATQ